MVFHSDLRYYNHGLAKSKQASATLRLFENSDNLQRHVESKHADIEKPGVKEKLLIVNELYYKNVEI